MKAALLFITILSYSCLAQIPIPVAATLLDTNGNGHYDRIDIMWTDTSTMKENNFIAQFVETLQVVTVTGIIILNATSIQPDFADKTIHIILKENTGTMSETIWQSAMVVLSDAPMSVDGRPFKVVDIINGVKDAVKFLPAKEVVAKSHMRFLGSYDLRGQKINTRRSFTILVQLWK
jgi:hypothetical protein